MRAERLARRDVERGGCSPQARTSRSHHGNAAVLDLDATPALKFIRIPDGLRHHARE